MCSAEPVSSEAPRVAPGGRSFLMVQQKASSFALTCPVQAFPIPDYRYNGMRREGARCGGCLPIDVGFISWFAWVECVGGGCRGAMALTHEREVNFEH